MPSVPGSSGSSSSQPSPKKEHKAAPLVETNDFNKQSSGVSTRMYSLYDNGPDPEKMLDRITRG